MKFLGDYVSVDRISVQPSQMGDDPVNLYSLPAYDAREVPERVIPGDIKSAKLRISGPVILFSKLNPRIPRIWYVENPGPDSYASTEFIPISASSPEVDIRYVYYWLSNQTSDIAAAARGTTGSHQRIGPEDLLVRPVSLPPMSKQRAIVATLSALDDKIESNQRIHSLALALARAEFDSALGSAASTRLADIATIVLGGTPSKSEAAFWGGREIAWINSGSANEEIILMPTEYITPLGLQKSAAKLMPQGATVLAITGATLGQVALLGIETTGNQSLVGIWGNSPEMNTWIHFAIQARIDDLLSHATGAAQQHVNKQNVEDLFVPIISPEELATWGRKVVPLVELAVSVATESIKLAALRDVLLPELLSGRIKVGEVAA